MINNFQLDKRLASDCIILGYLNLGRTNEPTELNKGQVLQAHSSASILLLMNKAEFPWLVIVPIDTSGIDIDELSEQQQLQLLKQVNVLSAFLKKHYPVDKINFASIGNIVKQMHFHLVARTEQDSAWPGVVWGASASKKYTNEQIEILKNLLNKEIEFFELNIRN